jgi:hypothetical protein
MKTKSALIRLAATLFLPFVLVGCPAITLVQLDNEWVKTYQARAELRKESRDFITSLSSFDENFAEISVRAAEEATKQNDPANEVTLYRIAILSAWQSQGKREDKIDELSTSGSAACRKLKDQDKSQPRDCALFKIVPALAWHEKKIPFVHTVTAKRGLDLTPEEMNDIPVVHADLYNAFEMLTTERVKLLELPLHEKFRAYVDEQWRSVYCNASSLAGNGVITDTMRKDNRDMHEKLIAARVYKPCKQVDASTIE